MRLSYTFLPLDRYIRLKVNVEPLWYLIQNQFGPVLGYHSVLLLLVSLAA